MKVASWILTVLAYACVITFIIIMTAYTGPRADLIAGAIVGYLIQGAIGHVLIDKYRKKRGRAGIDGWIVYVLTIIPYIALFPIIWFIRLCIHTDYSPSSSSSRSYDYDYDDDSSSSYSDSKPKEPEEKHDIVMTDMYNNVIKLDLYTYTSDLNQDSPFYGKSYHKYLDKERGEYYRSYDNGHTFIKERDYERMVFDIYFERTKPKI